MSYYGPNKGRSYREDIMPLPPPVPGFCQCGKPVVPGGWYCQEYEDILNEPDPWQEIEERERAEWQRQQAGEWE